MMALHLDDWERPPDQRGSQGMINRTRKKIEILKSPCLPCPAERGKRVTHRAAPVHFAATRPDALIFVWTSVIILAGAIGVVVARNPVHSALMLVMTLFGVAVIFVELQANFLAAVQVIVYAGAIVVLFLFVIMLLGVDQRGEPRDRAASGSEAVRGGPCRACARRGSRARVRVALVGRSPRGRRVRADQSGGDVAALGRSVFTTYLFPFEVTAALLVIAVVGAVVLSRSPRTTSRPTLDASTRSSMVDRSDRRPVRHAEGEAVEVTDASAENRTRIRRAASRRGDES